MKKVNCPRCEGLGLIDIDEVDFLYQFIGEKVKYYREKLGMTQGKLSEKVGLLRTSITNIEAGRQRLPLDKLTKLASALKVEIKDLMP